MHVLCSVVPCNRQTSVHVRTICAYPCLWSKPDCSMRNGPLLVWELSEEKTQKERFEWNRNLDRTCHRENKVTKICQGSFVMFIVHWKQLVENIVMKLTESFNVYEISIILSARKTWERLPCPVPIPQGARINNAQLFIPCFLISV